ncbi:MAG: hypothetical protein J4F41_02690, partial [Alphaproteobacteria bacterium]|nr:hypothetical protein [Alphaproteobacteria bacterium]
PMLITNRTIYRSVLNKLGGASAFESFFKYYPILFYPRIKIWRHSNLGIIQEKYGKSFDDYLKISIIRDPIEQFACFYDYRKGIPQPDDCAQQLLQQEKLSFDDFANLCAPNFFRSNQNIIDFRGSPKTRYIRYEHLYDDIQLLESDIPGLKGLSETLASIHLKRTGDLKPRVVSDDTRQVILNHAEFMRPFYPHLYSTVPEDDMAPFEEFPQAVNN